MIKIVALIVIIAFAQGARGECPNINDLPVYYNDNTFMCARFYYGFGNDLPLHGCNGCSIQEFVDVTDGANWDAGDGLQYPVGSLIVRPGCTFYQFNEQYYGGGWKNYEGPAIYSKIENGPDTTETGCAKGRPGIKCRCGMKHFSCVPEDSYNMVLICDATNAAADTECNYMKTVGTMYTETYSNSMSLDVTIKTEMSAKFEGLFSASVGVSVSTGYDWTSTSSETTSKEEKIEIKAVAPAGYVLRVEQAVGHCDGNTAKTELFRITHTNKAGEIVKEEYQKQFMNGTIVPFHFK
jgi:hypothetical protein